MNGNEETGELSIHEAVEIVRLDGGDSVVKCGVGCGIRHVVPTSKVYRTLAEAEARFAELAVVAESKG